MQTIREWWASMGAGNRRTAMILALVLVVVLVIAGVLGYQFQILPGLLGQ